MRNSQKSEESLDNAEHPLESGITKASDNRPEITYEIKVQDAPKIDSIRERSFAFAVRIVKLCGFLEKKSDVGKPVINQLLKSGTSVGAKFGRSGRRTKQSRFYP
jgi:hypothetical protein